MIFPSPGVAGRNFPTRTRDMKLKSKERRLWFTSDFHAFHDREFIWKKRGFASSERHVDALVSMVNDRAQPEDIVFHLGDLSLNCDAEKLTAFMKRIRCRHFLSLWGNHYSPSRSMMQAETLALGERPSLPWMVYAQEVFPWRLRASPNLVLMGDAIHAVVDNTPVHMSHYPHAVWDRAHHGAYHLCGHSHGGFDGSHPETGTARILDVGVDARFDLWSWAEIHALLGARPYAHPSDSEKDDE